MTTPLITVYATAYINMPNAITVSFSYPQPILGSCSNGVVQYLLPKSSGNYYFTWIPTSLTSTYFNFSINNSNITSTNAITPLAQTTATVSGTAYPNYLNIMTLIFSNSQLQAPTLGTVSNGSISSISGSGTNFTFNWTPTTLTSTSFNFTSVTGYTGTLVSTNTITPVLQSTCTVSGIAYQSIANTITVVFGLSQTTAPTLGTVSNGTVSGMSGSGTNFTFSWTPTTLTATLFNFTGVSGYSGTLTSINAITPQETCSVSGTAYLSMANTITVIFSNSQTAAPTLGTVSNGTISGMSGSGTTFTFSWTPTTTTATSFNFTSVTGYPGTLTSTNSITPLPQITCTVSGSANPNIANTMTVIFSNSQTTAPTLGTVSNGTVSGMSTGSGTTYTFTWTPTALTATSFNFTGVTGYTGTLTSTNAITPLPQTTCSVSGYAYQSQASTITVVFSNSQTSTPSLGSCSNGTVSGISGSGTTYTFSWTPSTTTATSFNFTGVTGYAGTLTSTNSLTPNINYSISPSYGSKSTYHASDGTVNIGSYGQYTITPNANCNLTFEMWGASGGSTDYLSGAGGYSIGKIPMVGGTSYIIIVGQRGYGWLSGLAQYNSLGGGGKLVAGDNGHASGGGMSGVFINSYTQANALIIAGGGGAGDHKFPGGAGGGLIAESANGYSGGSQSSGGTGGQQSGSALQGGNGGLSTFSGAGGGGYYGGSSGLTDNGGTGGSAYLAGIVINGSTQGGTGNTPGNSSGTNRGGAGQQTATQTDGTDGRVLITFS